MPAHPISVVRPVYEMSDVARVTHASAPSNALGYVRGDKAT